MTTKFTLRNIGLLPYDEDKKGYVLRFRIVSQDRNRMSSWSPFYVIPVPAGFQTDVSVSPSNLEIYETSLGSSKHLVSVTWTDQNDVLTGLNSLDVYTKQAAADWEYIGRFGLKNASNIVQRVFTITGTQTIQFSFHRPLKVPKTTGLSTLPANTQLFTTSKSVTA